MPGGNRRLPRTVRSTGSPSLVSTVSSEMSIGKYSALGSAPDVDPPPTPKHFPFPNTPVDNELVFEFLMFLYTTIAAASQFLQLYRSVWWLPHSYNNHAVNFYLIDINLVIFIMVILCRRIVYLIGRKLLEQCLSENSLYFSCLCYRIFLFGIMVVSLSWCAYYVIQNHPVVNMFYLCYPISVYLILFGFTLTPFFEFDTWNRSLFPPLHACTSNAEYIRAEVEHLKSNFNSRMKQILFSSVLNAYYAGLIPCCFAQSFVYYNTHWATQHVACLWLGCFSSYTTHMLPLRFCDTLHRSALHLGCWDRVEIRSHLPIVYTWQENVLWPFGSLVRYGKDVYRGLGEVNAAEPGNASSSRFFTIFCNPSNVFGALFAIHIVLVISQLTLLLRSYFYWHNIISVTLLLFFNYYTLFKIGRDYLISQRIYKAERAMQEKLANS